MSSSAASAEYTKKWHIYKGPLPREATSNFCFFAGRAHPELAQETAKFLGVPLSPLNLKSFTDGEVSIRIPETVRGKDVFIMQSVCRSATLSVNDALVELCLLVSAMRRHSASSITTVIPYYGYARQDRTLGQRVPISAADVAQMLATSGVDHVISLDLHVGQITGFFPARIPVNNLSAGPIGAYFFGRSANLQNPVIVSPDAGGVPRAKAFRDVLAFVLGVEIPMAIIIKQRSGASKIERMDLVGDVKNRDAIIVDDMIDTAGTLCKAAGVLKDMGAKRVFAFATHGIFSGPAAQRIRDSVLTKVIVGNGLPLPVNFNEPKVSQLSVAPLLAEAISVVHQKSSLTTSLNASLAKANKGKAKL